MYTRAAIVLAKFKTPTICYSCSINNRNTISIGLNETNTKQQQ